MKKKKWDRKGNVFIFPGTGQALIQKGRAALEAKQYDEAASFLSQALEHPLTEEGDVKTALLLALYESGRYDSALELCKDMLHKGLGDYYDVLDIYVLILMQQKQYKTIFSTLSALMEEKQLPEEKREYFERLLELSRKMLDAPETRWMPLFTGQETLREQTLRLMELAHVNIQPYYDELVAMLEKEGTHPFLQTLILNVLKEHGIERAVTVRKFEFTGSVIPVQLSDAFEKDYFKKVIHFLEDELADKDPVQLEQVKEIVKHHFFLIYPFEPKEISPEGWARASLRQLRTYYQEPGLETENELDKEVQKSLAFMRKLDEISSPIM
ncbi:tetratricopeptide repeat protein [Pseudobacillus wudalianchiensis]|uniref:Hydrolase n=1 Tax=Pseudobacillus wudalianchiensis TaxID=1743143 RepID=A0A1B9B8G1_9BACI|nr:bacterial transcriptional activator domain-containing protein [Bacillus wudalianchiensis]OCA92370.1 hypothetical protein A8F95_01245 [Bacillus wudalianchiensis]